MSPVYTNRVGEGERLEVSGARSNSPFPPLAGERAGERGRVGSRQRLPKRIGQEGADAFQSQPPQDLACAREQSVGSGRYKARSRTKTARSGAAPFHGEARAPRRVRFCPVPYALPRAR